MGILSMKTILPFGGSYGNPPLDPKQIISFEELLMPQGIQQEALIRLLMEKGIFTK